MANELESNVEDFRGNAPAIDPNILKEAMAVGNGQELPTPEPKAEEAAETKPVEQKTEEQPTEQPKAETKVEKSVSEILAELTDGKLKSKEEIEALFEKANAPKEYKSEFAKQLDEYVAKGGDPKKFLEYQTKDYSQHTEGDLIKLKLIEENPELTQREVDALFNKKYGYYDEDDDSDEAVAARAEQRLEAKKALQFFETKKVKDLEAPIDERQKAAEDYLAQQKVWEETHTKEVDSFFSEKDALKFEFAIQDSADKDKLIPQVFEWKLNATDKQNLVEAQKKVSLLSYCTDEGGRINQEKLAMVTEFAKNPSKFLTAMANNLVSNERERFVNEDLINAKRPDNMNQEKNLSKEQILANESRERRL